MKGKSTKRMALYVVAALGIAVAAYLALQPRGGSAGAIQHLGPQAALEMLQRDPKAVLVDVRTPGEFQSGHLRGALNVELDRLEGLAAQALPDKDAHLIVYCHTGNRSSFAVNILEKKGYTHLVNVVGGIAAWGAQGLPIVRD